ncbi:MAG: SAM-dependent methyltransferase [Marmoricola sp.]
MTSSPDCMMEASKSDSEPGQVGVTLVGGGPGDADLITVAGRKALLSADVVVADRLAPQGLLGDLPAHVEVVDVAKLPRGRSAQQAEINEVIVQRALEGKQVVRLKGGDNFVFGRGFEEIQACEAAGVPVTVIPGISSPLAVPALAGIPVTHRGITHEFTVISGHLPPRTSGVARGLGTGGRAARDSGVDDGSGQYRRDHCCAAGRRSRPCQACGSGL